MAVISNTNVRLQNTKCDFERRLKSTKIGQRILEIQNLLVDTETHSVLKKQKLDWKTPGRDSNIQHCKLKKKANYANFAALDN